jgi:predicted nucleic acid-binding protein
MKIFKNSKVYCDANFLIAYAAKEVKQPEIKKRAKFLFGEILASNSICFISPLTLDECWLGIRKELGPKRVINKFRYNLNQILGKIGLRLKNYGTIEFSYKEIFDDLKRFSEEIINHPKFKIIQFKNPKSGVKRALENLKVFGIKPRDAFHLSYIQEKNIDYLITGDIKLQKKLKNNPATPCQILSLYGNEV